MFNKIKTKLTTGFMLMAMGPLIIGLVFNYYQRFQNNKAESIQKLIAVRDLKVQQVESWLHDIEQELHILSNCHEIMGMDVEKGYHQYDKDAVSALLYEHVMQSNESRFISIADAKTGLISVSTNNSLIGKNISQADYFINAIHNNGVYIKDIFRSKDTGEPRMIFSIAFRSGDNFKGVICINTGLSNSLYKLLSNRTGLGKTGETLIVNKKVYALNHLRWSTDPPLQLKINAEPAVNSSNGLTGYGESVDYRGKKILTAYTHIPLTSWGFVAKQDLEELMQPIRNTLYKSLLLFLLILIAVIIVTYKLSKKIAEPILEMAENTHKIEDGDYTVRNKVTTNDELSILAESMNSMASAIESRIFVQNGVDEIVKKIIPSKDIATFAEYTLRNLIKITKADFGAFFKLDKESNDFILLNSVGIDSSRFKPFNADKRDGEFGKVLLTKDLVYIKNIPSNSKFVFKTISGDFLPNEIITFPLVVNKKVQAIISLGKLNSFCENCIDIAKQANLILATIFSNRLRDWHLNKLNIELKNNNAEMEIQTEGLKRQSEELELQNTELEIQKQEIKEANKLKSEFLSNMSHELRTPLNSIIALSKVLLMETSDKLTSEQYNYLSIVSRNGKELLSLINSILDLSKIEAGKTSYNVISFPIISVIRNIEEKLIGIIEKKGINLILNYDDELPNIESDKGKLMHVLQNIIGNAAKFTHCGHIEIGVKLSSNKRFFTITVEDTGIGIPKHELPKIFDEFKQVDGTTSREYEGTGLGLAIAHKTLTLLNGKVEVDSEVGKGTIFKITLPVNWQGKKTEEPVPGPENIISPVKTVNQPLKGNNRILIIEDNPHTVTQIKYILEKEGFIIDIASGGQEGIDYIKHTVPNGIILDLMMPGVDGFEVLETLRETELTKETPVLILTAKDLTSDDIKKLSSNHIQQLIFKGDVDQDELLMKIKKMMGMNISGKPELTEVTTANEATKVKIKGTKPSILIVEDNKDNITTLKAILKNNYILHEANDGVKGVEMAFGLLPDLILLDIGLPKKDGIQVAGELKNSDTTRNIPIIALTAHAMKEDKKKILNAGCNDYVTKPLDPIVLLDKLANWWE